MSETRSRLAPVARTRPKLLPGAARGFGPSPEVTEPTVSPIVEPSPAAAGEEAATTAPQVVVAVPAPAQVPPVVQTAPASAPAAAPKRRRGTATTTTPPAYAGHRTADMKTKRTYNLSDDVTGSVEIAQAQFGRSHREYFRSVGRPTDSGFIEMLIQLGLKHLDDEQALSLLPQDGRRTRFMKDEAGE